MAGRERLEGLDREISAKFKAYVDGARRLSALRTAPGARAREARREGDRPPGHEEGRVQGGGADDAGLPFRAVLDPRRGDRRRGIPHLAQPGRGAPPPAPDRLRRGAVAGDARPEIARQGGRSRKDAGLRRDRRRDRRKDRRRRRREAQVPRPPAPGPLHHASSPDRRVRHAPFPGRKVGRAVADLHHRPGASAGGPGRRRSRASSPGRGSPRRPCRAPGR